MSDHKKQMPQSQSSQNLDPVSIATKNLTSKDLEIIQQIVNNDSSRKFRILEAKVENINAKIDTLLAMQRAQVCK